MTEEYIKTIPTFINFILTGIFSRTRLKSELLASEFNIEIFNNIEDLYLNTKTDLVFFCPGVKYKRRL